MEAPPPKSIAYKRCKFSTRLPAAPLYTASHFWLQRDEALGLWRIGLTKFATRMLGDLVECNFEVQPGAVVEVGQVIGNVEGFKAASDIYCVATGEFVGGNPALDEDTDKIRADPYGKGWLYQVRGEPEPGAMDVHGYMGVLNATIDKMVGDDEDEQP